MPEGVRLIGASTELTALADRLRAAARAKVLTPLEIVAILERWGAALGAREFEAIPGIAFLRLWLRRGVLEPILVREFGAAVLDGTWRDDGAARLGVFPVGLVGHWPAGNVEIQPFLSLSCALLGGNACLVRVPSDLVEQSESVLSVLRGVDPEGLIADRIALVSFDHGETSLQRAMAAAVDGAMIWGGEEAVTQVRALPFPHWAHIAVFGPRLSVAAMDALTWSKPDEQLAWCQRIARDVWQFEQQACSSPQTLFLERRAGHDHEGFIACLERAFIEENRLHPRLAIRPALTAAITLARANWLLADQAHRARYPLSPDWTILEGESSAIPTPTQGRTLYVLVVDDLGNCLARFDGAVQTLGLAIGQAARERELTELAARHGVDRIVKLGRMHVFGSPWDGLDLVRPMTRVVRHLPSQDPVAPPL